MFTSEYLFVVSAVLLNGWISKDGLFDIRVLGTVHIAAFLFAALLLLRRFSAAALIFIFCDAGYVSYFNSFFTEPASYILLLLLVALWLKIVAEGTPRLLPAFTVVGVLWITAKPQNFLPGLILAAYLLRFCSKRWSRRFRLPLLCSAALASAAIFIYADMPKQMKAAPVYDVVFMGILPRSPDPAADLKWFGLDPALAKYSGSGAFTLNTAFTTPGFADDLLAHVSYGRIFLFHLRHPRRLLETIRDALPRSTSLRAEYSGNFEKISGYPPGSRSSAFSLWSGFRSRLAHRAWILPAFLLVSTMLALLEMKRNRRLAECYCVLALMALVSFFTVALGDTWDMVKHFFVYNLLTDICITMFFTGLVSRLKW